MFTKKTTTLGQKVLKGVLRICTDPFLYISLFVKRNSIGSVNEGSTTAFTFFLLFRLRLLDTTVFFSSSTAPSPSGSGDTAESLDPRELTTIQPRIPLQRTTPGASASLQPQRTTPGASASLEPQESLAAKDVSTVAPRLPPLRTTPSTTGVSNFHLLLGTVRGNSYMPYNAGISYF
jgi:hypothetical protein